MSHTMHPVLPLAEVKKDYIVPSAFLTAHREAFYRTTLLSIGDAVIATDRDCLITFMNPVAEALTGWTYAEAMGRPFSEVFQITSEADDQLLEDPVSKVLRLGTTVILPKDIFLNARNGKKMPIDDSSALIVEDNGESVGAVVVFRDVTRRVSGEVALRKSDKLATAGMLAATIAHEINNPLAAVTNLVFILQGEPDLSDSMRQKLELIDRELSRVSLIAKQALGLHRHSVEAKLIDVRQLLDELLILYHGRLGSKKITLQKNYGPVVLIEAYEGDLRQVFSNLIANAVDAMGEAGVLHLHTRNAGNAENPGIEIGVGDNGTGISAKDLDGVFEPFYTTKETGSGLGLWVVKQIVEEHGGTVRIQSSMDSPKTGTCFTVFLPITLHERPSVRLLAYAPEFPQQDRRQP